MQRKAKVCVKNAQRDITVPNQQLDLIGELYIQSNAPLAITAQKVGNVK